MGIATEVPILSSYLGHSTMLLRFFTFHDTAIEWPLSNMPLNTMKELAACWFYNFFNNYSLIDFSHLRMQRLIGMFDQALGSVL